MPIIDQVARASLARHSPWDEHEIAWPDGKGELLSQHGEGSADTLSTHSTSESSPQHYHAEALYELIKFNLHEHALLELGAQEIDTWLAPMRGSPLSQPRSQRESESSATVVNIPSSGVSNADESMLRAASTHSTKNSKQSTGPNLTRRQLNDRAIRQEVRKIRLLGSLGLNPLSTYDLCCLHTRNRIREIYVAKSYRTGFPQKTVEAATPQLLALGLKPKTVAKQLAADQAALARESQIVSMDQQGHTPRQIATTVDVSVDVVRRIIRRATAALKVPQAATDALKVDCGGARFLVPRRHLDAIPLKYREAFGEKELAKGLLGFSLGVPVETIRAEVAISDRALGFLCHYQGLHPDLQAAALRHVTEEPEAASISTNGMHTRSRKLEDD